MKLKLSLRTPPSQIEKASLSPSEWANAYKGSEKLRLNVRNRNLNLVRVFTFKNTGDEKVSVTLNRRHGLSLTQYENYIDYESHPCSYETHSSPAYREISRDVVILPMDERLLPEALNSVKDIGLTDDLSIDMDSGEIVSFGIYALGSEVDSFIDQGPKGSSMRTVNVVSSCEEVCTEHDCCHVHCNPIPKLNLAPSCACSDSYTRINHRDIQVGTERGGISLNAASPLNAQVTYAGDEESAQARTYLLIQNPIPVTK